MAPLIPSEFVFRLQSKEEDWLNSVNLRAEARPPFRVGEWNPAAPSGIFIKVWWS